MPAELTRLLCIGSSKRQLFDEGGIERAGGTGEPSEPSTRDSGAGMEKVDSQVSVASLDGLVNVFDVGDVEGARDAEDGQDDRLVLLVDEDLQFFDLGFFRQKGSGFVSDAGFLRLLLGFRHMTVEETRLRFGIHSLREFLG